MEEPVHFMIIYLLNQDGLVLREVLEFTRAISLFECLGFGDQHREAISTYYKDINRWVLNDGSGNTFFGYSMLSRPGQNCKHLPLREGNIYKGR